MLPPYLFKKTKSKIIKGKFISCLLWGLKKYRLTQIRVYADWTMAGINFFFPDLGDKPIVQLKKLFPKFSETHLVRLLGESINEDDNTITFEEFKYLVKKKYVTQSYKGRVLWFESLLGDLEIDVDTNTKDEYFIQEVEDTIIDLNGKPTNIRKCLNMLCEFLLVPESKKEIYRKKLNRAYLNVPDFQRQDIYPLPSDFERKTPVEDILYKREGRLDNYDEFVKVYDDDFFESKYKKRKS